MSRRMLALSSLPKNTMVLSLDSWNEPYLECFCVALLCPHCSLKFVLIDLRDMASNTGAFGLYRIMKLSQQDDPTPSRML